MTTIAYNSLNIHQKINWKNQFGICADRDKYHLACNIRLNGVFTRAISGVNPNSWFWDWYYIHY